LPLIPAATVFSNDGSKYRFINLKPGNYQLRCHVLDGYVYYKAPVEHQHETIGSIAHSVLFAERGSVPGLNHPEASILQVRIGENIKNIVAVSASALKHEQEGFLREGFHDFIPKPFHIERVCECLKNLLQVEYEVKQQGEEKERAPSEYTTLPEEILTSLTEAAKTHNVTRVGQCLEQLRQTVEDGHPLVEELYRLFQNYDMDGILKVSEDNQTRGMI
jgi:CheY-like chemotaxis protein